jgi:putative tryptophan/tyrosine transport system substrate-binding protein
MRRREFITLLGGGVSWPLTARAQQSERVRRVAVLHSSAQVDEEPFVTEFKSKMQQFGWSAGRNIRFDHRFAANDPARYGTYAAEVVGLRPEVIVATNTPTLQALLQHTQAIPIVFYRVSDPLATGVVTSLARPGANITGFTNQEFSVSGKWLELLKDVAPSIVRLMIILDPENPTWRGYLRTIETSAPAIGVQVLPVAVISAVGIERALEDFAREPNGALVVLPGAVTNSNLPLITRLAIRHRLPAVYPSSANAITKGGLMSYGPSLIDQVRKTAGYVDRILRGEKPGDLPVQQPTKFDLIINLKTAKALGITVPPALLARADEVIE